MCNISNSVVEFKLISCSRSDPEPLSGCNYACPPLPCFLCQGAISPHKVGTLTGHCCKKQPGTQWTKPNPKGLQPSSHAAAHGKPKYQFSKRQDLNLSCSAAQQTLCLTSWCPKGGSSLETPRAGSPGKLRQTLQLNCYNALFTHSCISRHQHVWKSVDIIQRKPLLSLQIPPICSARNTCTLLPSCDRSQLLLWHIHVLWKRAENSSMLQPAVFPARKWTWGTSQTNFRKEC